MNAVAYFTFSNTVLHECFLQLEMGNKMLGVIEFGKDQNEANPEVRVLIQYTSKEKATILILQTSCASCLLGQIPC